MDYANLWSKILDKAKAELTTFTYNSWFSETKLFKIEDGVAIIIVPYAYHKKRLENTYKKYITNLLLDEVGDNLDLKFLLEEEINDNNEDIVIEKKENIKELDNSNSTEDDIPFESKLNSKYTFDSFVVGNCNKLAYTAAMSIAERPGELYNPLFIYGNSGLGKTHLMHAIGNYIVEHSKKKVLYVKSDDFQKEYTRIFSKNKDENFEYMDFFRKKYRDIDVLIIDDIQSLENAPSTRQEFFHTFNNLYDDKKQIIISSDRSPNDLKLFEDRLKTRFLWGLTVDIYPPDYETKLAIYKKKLQNENLEDLFPEEVITYMASNIGTDIREIEGSINRVMAYGTMMGGNITLELATEALKNFINKGYSEKPDVSRIEKIVADYYQISIEDLKSKKRDANKTFPRQIAMYLIRKITDESFPKIGLEFGGKDHSTVMHSCEKIAKEIEHNEELKKLINKLESDIRNQ